MQNGTPRSLASRRLHAAGGWICVSLGTAGAVLPILPTTCFMIAALWFFSRSSPQLAEKLLSHRRFGPALRQWQDTGAISTRAKAVAIGSMALSWSVVFATSSSYVAPAIVGSLSLPIAAYILSRSNPEHLLSRPPTGGPASRR
jgi:uncharacterized membrane protein YbaN (DUF454 family)